MNQTRLSRPARVALPMLAVAAVLNVALVAPAHAAETDNPVTATYSRAGVGLDNAVQAADGKWWPAGSQYLKLSDGTEVEAYCIQFNNFTVDKTGTYVAQGWPAVGLSTQQLAEISDIASHHDQLGTPLDKTSWENAATQVAIWSISDNMAYKKIPSKLFVARVSQLLADATDTASAPAFDYDLAGKKDVTGTGADSQDVVSGVLTSADGAPVANQDVTFDVDGTDQVVKTDDTGVATLQLPRSQDARTVSISFTTQVAPGTVMVPQSGAQPMILADGFTENRQVSASIAAYTPPALTTTPTTTPAPAPKKHIEKAPAPKVAKDPVPKSYPHTGGFPLVPGVATAAGLSVLGLWGRRKFAKR